VLAQDYFSDIAAWEKARGPMPKALSGVNGRVAKEIMHLSYARLKVTANGKPWPFPKIAAAISLLAASFASAVDSSLVDSQ
jgi:hypothetical protein